jgi:hypothetical protein
VGVLMRNEDSDWVKMGKLLAMRPDPGADWRLGVVRRITRVDQEWRKIGVEFISDRPRLAHIDPEAMASMSYSVDDAGLLPSGQSATVLLVPIGDAELILMESAKYAHGKTYRLQHDGDTAHIRLDTVRDKGDGWLLSTYSVVG